MPNEIATLLALILALSPAISTAQVSALGAGRAISNVTTQLGGKLFNRKNLIDIEAEHAKVFDQFETQSAGMDEAQKAHLHELLAKAWSLNEQQILEKNARASGDSGPIIDFKQVASAYVGGHALVGNASLIAFGGGSMSSVLQTSVMNGIVSGLDDQDPAGSMAINYSGIDTSGSVSDAAVSGATVAVSNEAGKSVTGRVSGGVRSMFGRGEKTTTIKLTKNLHPLTFAGNHPSELRAKDLYRENGFLGLKQIDQKPTAHAYAPVMANSPIKAAIYTFDEESGDVTAAFRILKANATDFASLVESAADQLDEEPRYASNGGALRAVWKSGAFLAADAQQVSYGWSSQVSSLYEKAGQTVAQTEN